MNDSVAADYEALEARFTAWAQARPDVRALLVVGSRARQEVHPADRWSDLDLIAFVLDVAPYVRDRQWLDALGDVWLAFLEQTGAEDPEWFIMFEGVRDVDVVFVALPEDDPAAVARVVQARGMDVVLRRGMRTLVDKDGGVARMSLPLAQRAAPPAAAAFEATISAFWLNAERAAKKLRRGEVYEAKRRCDDVMKARLLQMIEWHARARHGWDYDTWHVGRFIETWADPRALAGLRDTYARYEAGDIARALLATMGLFRALAVETAGALGYPYPALIDERLTRWVGACLAGDDC